MPNVIRITDFNDPALDVYARLTEAQLLNRHCLKEGLFIAESPKVIDRALDAGYIPVSFLAEERLIRGEALEVIERCGDIPVYTGEFDLLTQITGYKLTRGMLCAMHRRELPTAEDLCRKATRIAVLEDVMNPTNLGAIFRSAAALGIQGILLTPACTNPLYRRCLRVSMGTVFQVPWTYAGEDWLEKLHGMGFAVAVGLFFFLNRALAEVVVVRGKTQVAVMLGVILFLPFIHGGFFHGFFYDFLHDLFGGSGLFFLGQNYASSFSLVGSWGCSGFANILERLSAK